MGTLVNYLVKGSYNVRTGILIGVIIYLLLFSVLLVIPGRRKVTLRNLPELLLICCCTSILSITGAFSLNFATFQFGFANVGLIPFLGGSVVPMVLNFLLFVPLGFLLLLVFQKLNWKKALLIGCGFSAFIELLQLFGGRYAELEDIVLNSAGTLAGFLFLDCLKTCKKKSILSSFCSLP